MKERFQGKKKAVHGNILGLTQGQSQGQMRKAGRGQSSRPSGSSEVSTCLCESEGKKNVALFSSVLTSILLNQFGLFSSVLTSILINQFKQNRSPLISDHSVSEQFPHFSPLMLNWYRHYGGDHGDSVKNEIQNDYVTQLSHSWR